MSSITMRMGFPSPPDKVRETFLSDIASGGLPLTLEVTAVEGGWSAVYITGSEQDLRTFLSETYGMSEARVEHAVKQARSTD